MVYCEDDNIGNSIINNNNSNNNNNNNDNDTPDLEMHHGAASLILHEPLFVGIHFVCPCG